ncbi:hypothetical protein Back11_12510 [Paenibacillus baekrokdamisoli]|uniref:Uncharacterized protein n=1 Tax=Paenibacillus baekrokdamisoli TaxID=1712516 RepID=A0A3G9INK9_9BACL|nr:hypothetical protein Back11_12510 [Paenibacillus baekrokdamisoli]
MRHLGSELFKTSNILQFVLNGANTYIQFLIASIKKISSYFNKFLAILGSYTASSGKGVGHATEFIIKKIVVNRQPN